MFELNSLSFIEHFSEDFSSYPWNFCVLCLSGNEVCSVFKSNNYFWGLAHISGIWMGVCVPFCCLLSLHLTCFSASLAHWGLLFGSLKLLLRVEVQQQVIMLQVLFGPLTKGVISEGHRYLGICKAGCFGYLLSTALHCYQNTLPVH